MGAATDWTANKIKLETQTNRNTISRETFVEFIETTFAGITAARLNLLAQFRRVCNYCCWQRNSFCIIWISYLFGGIVSKRQLIFCGVAKGINLFFFRLREISIVCICFDSAAKQ